MIVGVHTPEFAFEHEVSNVRRATRELGIRYPVAIDDDAATWGAYQNSYWPAEYLIDRHGDIREIKEGEGDYDATESKIRELLGQPATTRFAPVADTTPDHLTMTPESYLGWQRLDRYSGSQIVPGRMALYRFGGAVPPDSLAYSGLWRVEGQRIVAGPGARLRLNFDAQNVFLVLGGHGRIQVRVNGKPVDTVQRLGAQPALHAAALSEGAHGTARAALHARDQRVRLYVRLEAAPGATARGRRPRRRRSPRARAGSA